MVASKKNCIFNVPNAQFFCEKFQGLVHELFLSLCWTASRSFGSLFFRKKKDFLLHPHENSSTFMGQQGWVEILMITLVYSQKLLPQNISAGSVPSRYFGSSINSQLTLSKQEFNFPLNSRNADRNALKIFNVVWTFSRASSTSTYNAI